MHLNHAHFFDSCILTEERERERQGCWRRRHETDRLSFCTQSVHLKLMSSVCVNCSFWELSSSQSISLEIEQMSCQMWTSISSLSLPFSSETVSKKKERTFLLRFLQKKAIKTSASLNKFLLLRCSC